MLGVYIDKNGDLFLAPIQNGKISSENAIYKSKKAEKHIIDLLKENEFDIELQYMDMIINTKTVSFYFVDYRRCLISNEIKCIIKKQLEKNEIKKVKPKKVCRVNKYTKRKIIVFGLSTLILTGGIGLVTKSTKTEAINSASKSLSTKFERDKNDEGDFIIMTPNKEHTNFNTLEKLNDVEQQNEINNSSKLVEKIVKEVNNQIETKIQEIKDDRVFINYEDRSIEQKVYDTRQNYGNTISKYACMYGLDPNLLTAIATQERGVHSTTMDVGGATGLMQVQNAVWSNQILKAYNFETNSLEEIVVDENRLSELDYNIKIGCMILQSNMEYMNYNAFAAVQCYNMGYGNVRKILTQYSFDTGKSIDEILNSNDLGWLEYRDMITVGDQRYLENVLSWIGPSFEINTCMKDGTIINTSISCAENVKKVNN